MKLMPLHHRDFRDIEREASLFLGAGLLLIATTMLIYTYAASMA